LLPKLKLREASSQPTKSKDRGAARASLLF
jgi:hypothetical protein